MTERYAPLLPQLFALHEHLALSGSGWYLCPQCPAKVYFSDGRVTKLEITPV